LAVLLFKGIYEYDFQNFQLNAHSTTSVPPILCYNSQIVPIMNNEVQDAAVMFYALSISQLSEKPFPSKIIQTFGQNNARYSYIKTWKAHLNWRIANAFNNITIFYTRMELKTLTSKVESNRRWVHRKRDN